MIITESISISAANEEDVELIERLLNSKLPSDYRRFLLEINGGRPSPNRFENDLGIGSVVHFFFTADPASEFYQITQMINDYRGRIPRKLLPVASDPFGNLLLLDTGARSAGAVYFWDHEGENMEGDPWWKNIALVATSFTDFVSKLF